MRAAEPVALGAWYRDCLGLDAEENGLWRQEAGPTRHGGCRSIRLVTDPEGNRIELWRPVR